MRYHLTAIRMVAIVKKQNKTKIMLNNKFGEDVEKLEYVFTDGRHVRKCCCYENGMAVAQNLKIELLYYLPITPLGIYSKELKVDLKGIFVYPYSWQHYSK